MMKRTTWGWALIAAPFVGLLLSVMLYAVTNAVISAQLAKEAERTNRTAGVELESDVLPEGLEASLGNRDGVLSPGAPSSEPELRSVIGNGVNVLLGLLGMLSVLGIFVLIPLGIYLLVSDGKKKSV